MKKQKIIDENFIKTLGWEKDTNLPLNEDNFVNFIFTATDYSNIYQIDEGQTEFKC